jgi:hypothetical protein
MISGVGMKMIALRVIKTAAWPIRTGREYPNHQAKAGLTVPPAWRSRNLSKGKRALETIRVTTLTDQMPIRVWISVRKGIRDKNMGY